jgi:hypothetical protein
MLLSAKHLEMRRAVFCRLHRRGFRRRFCTTVLLSASRLVGVIGGSSPSALLDEVESG